MRNAKSKRALATLILATLIAAPTTNAVMVDWEGGTDLFTSANWTVDGVPNQVHPGNDSDTISTTISGGTVNAFNFADFQELNVRIAEGVDTLTITGGATINADFIQVSRPTSFGLSDANNITLENGTITVSNPNGFRSRNIGFQGFINFTGGAGSAAVIQTNNTGTNPQKLAGKLSSGSPSFTGSYFAIDGTMVGSGVEYDGSNIADVNAGLANTVINGRYFQIQEDGGTQTLVIIPEPSAMPLAAVGLLALLCRRRN